MIYKIKDEYLEVINYCNEYDEYIFKRFSQFEIVTNKEINNYLRFNETSVEININGDYKILKNRIVKTDIYPIINNVIAYCRVKSIGWTSRNNFESFRVICL